MCSSQKFVEMLLSFCKTKVNSPEIDRYEQTDKGDIQGFAVFFVVFFLASSYLRRTFSFKIFIDHEKDLNLWRGRTQMIDND